jgi:ankyrin repeat protein
LKSLLSLRGYEVKVFCRDSLPAGLFDDIKQEGVDNYGFEVLKAIRGSDIEKLRKFHPQGRSLKLKCSNKFGESLLHLACRKALVPVVKFLLDEAGVPLRVRDDMGRSPLHDGFWTPRPNFDLVDYFLKKDPNLLLISDRRGHTPLAYSRLHDWAKWNAYFKSRAEILTPTLFYWATPHHGSL